MRRETWVTMAVTAAVYAGLYAVTAVTGLETTLLAWPGGILVGNLLASLVLGIPALFHLHRKIDSQHNDRAEQHESLMREVLEWKHAGHGKASPAAEAAIPGK